MDTRWVTVGNGSSVFQSPKITAYRVSFVSWLLKRTSKHHSEKPQHLFLTPNDLKKMLRTYFPLARSYCASAGKIQPCRCLQPSNSLLANGSSRSHHLNSESQPRMWSMINIFFPVAAPQCRSSETFQSIFQTSFSSEVEEQENKKMPLKGSRCTWRPNARHGGKARRRKVMEEICQVLICDWSFKMLT